MAFEFKSTQTNFFTQFRNGNLFTDNPLELSLNVRGNVDDKLRYSEIIEVEITVNETESLTFNYDSSGASGVIISPGLNFVNEGLAVGLLVDVIQGDDIMESTIESITGTGFNTITLDKTNLDPLEDGPHTNVVIRVKTAPDELVYKYGLIKDNITGISEANYASPLDGNPQAFQKGSIGAGFAPMVKLGTFNSWVQTQDLQVKFNGTTGDYTHVFEIRHDFQIPYFKDGEQGNIEDLINPDNLLGTFTLKYANGFFFGDAASIYSKFEKLGSNGSVGYYNENYNGSPNIFTINSLTITNDLDTGTIETTLTNIFAVNITASAATFIAAQKVVVFHSLLTDETTYSNNVDTFDEVFLRDSILQLGGAGALSSTVIKNLTVTFNSSTDIDIDGEIELTTDQQAQITASNQFVLSFSVGNESFPVNFENNVNLRFIDNYSATLDIPGLIVSHIPSYYDAFNTYAGASFGTDFKGWDGDMVGVSERFNLIQFLDGFTKITNVVSRLFVFNSTTEEEFELWTKTVPIGTPLLTTGAGFTYHIYNSFTNDDIKFPAAEPLNVTSIESFPPFPVGLQSILIQSAIPRVTWRDFILNETVPAEFFDASKPQDNLNQKASNYQIAPWNILHEFIVTVDKFQQDIGTIAAILEGTTDYRLWSDHFDIVDFDIDPGGIFSGVVRTFDIIGDETTEISCNQPNLIKVQFDHSLGLLPIGDLWGRIWIERDNIDTTPWQLFTDRNWTHEFNPLVPSQSITPGNTEFVEIESLVDQVNIVCADFTNLSISVKLVTLQIVI